MKIDLSQLVSGRVTVLKFDDRVQLNSDDFVAYGVKNFQNVNISGCITREGREMTLEMAYSFTASFDCSRCLVEVEKTFNDSVVKILKEDIKEGDVESGLVSYSKNELDLEHVLIDEIVLSIPMNVLCKDDCLGLCQDCGKNLNQGDCECDKDRIDPRFEDLKNIFS